MLECIYSDFSRDTKKISFILFFIFNNLRFGPAQIILPDGTGRVRELLRDATGETFGLSVGETASLKQDTQIKK